MLSVTLYFQYLLKQINYVEHDETPTLSQEQLNEYLAEEEDSDASAPSMDAGDVEFKDHTTQIGGKGSGLVNILLIGQDRRPGESRARSDTMILCTFNKHTKTLTMTSFLRDLYVEIPGYQDNRINAAYAAGGMSLLNETLKENFGIHIDGNIEVDFNQFAQIVDLLGGVTMELRQDEADVINRDAPGTVSAGTQLLTGQQALAYARIRSLDADGDFSRTNRQRKVISALLDSYKNASLSTVLSLLDDILPMITTDMNDVKIIAYATELFPMLSGADIVSQRIPADGSYSGKMINGMSVLVADMEASRQLLEDTLLN
jgi:LCP family protein required for cell wall assembly